MRLFPLFADLRGRQVLVVGGGVVATRKVEALLEAGAHVTVGAPRHAPELLALAAAGRICVRSGDFAPDWLDGAWLVVAATDERDINSAVAAAADARRMLANVVDDPELSTFQVPAVVDRAPLVIAVSSAGAAPVLARRVRERMESLFDQSLGELASLAQRHRQAIRAARPDMPARRAFYDWLYDGEVAALLRAGRREQAEQALLAAIEQAEVPRRGRLILLGAGPGPAGQLTLQALRALNEADIIVHAPDVSQEVMGQARRDAHRRQSTAAAAPDAALLRDLGMETAGGSTVVLAAAGAGPALDAAARQWLDDEQVLTIEIRGLAG